MPLPSETEGDDELLLLEPRPLSSGGVMGVGVVNSASSALRRRSSAILVVARDGGMPFEWPRLTVAAAESSGSGARSTRRAVRGARCVRSRFPHGSHERSASAASRSCRERLRPAAPTTAPLLPLRPLRALLPGAAFMP